MIRKYLCRIGARILAFWDMEDPEERIEGSGEVYLDPAYNAQYTAERRLQRLSKADELQDVDVPTGPTAPDRPDGQFR